MVRVRVLSVVYGGISRVKQPHLGVVGNILDKEIGKDLPRALGLSVMHWAAAISICNTANEPAFGQRRAETLMLSYVPSIT
jgi:hypothetical protein